MNFLLKNTKLRVRTNEGLTFATNIGVPQGDGLSPVLFTTYLEAAMKDIRKKLAYADDVDFISKDGIDFDIVKKTLASWNKGKTETLSIDGTNGECKKSKKLEMLDFGKEWKRRKNLAMVAMRKMNKIWTSSMQERKRYEPIKHMSNPLCFSAAALGR